MSDVVSIDPRTAAIAEVVASISTALEVDTLCSAAAAAAPALERLGRAGRATRCGPWPMPWKPAAGASSPSPIGKPASGQHGWTAS